MKECFMKKLVFNLNLEQWVKQKQDKLASYKVRHKGYYEPFICIRKKCSSPPRSKHPCTIGTTKSVLEESNQTEAAGKFRSHFGLTGAKNINKR